MMFTRLPRIEKLALFVLAMTVVGWIAIGCNSTSPFLAASFNATLPGIAGGLGSGNGTTIPPPSGNNNTGGGGTNDVITQVSDLPLAQRSIRVSIQNASTQFVKFAMTFAVSAGPGGFVPDDMIQDYLDAGYSDAILPGSNNDLSIGCDVITLLSGTRLLVLQFGTLLGETIKIQPNMTDTNSTTFPSITLQTLDGNTSIPLPEFVIFGNDDPDFVCTGGASVGDLCTQRGFVYINAFDVPVGKAAEASRIQGTICAQNFGSAPEWRLDKTLDNFAQPFQFAPGGTIVVTVLDRALDAPSNPRKQVVWLATDANDRTIHFPDQ